MAIGLLAALGAAVGIFAAVRSRRTRHFAELALCDHLTGVANRRRLDRDLTIEASNGDTPVAVIMVDVDHFKRINDEHGHDAGDQVLRAVADVLRQEVRTGDVVYRYGGEEFCVLLAKTNTTEAGQVAERIRFAVSRMTLAIDEPLTVSIGVALGKGDARCPDDAARRRGVVQVERRRARPSHTRRSAVARADGGFAPRRPGARRYVGLTTRQPELP